MLRVEPPQLFVETEISSPLSVRAVVLQGLLSGDASIATLVRRVRDLTDSRIVLHRETAYPVIRALERDGLVSGRLDMTAKAGRGIGQRPTIFMLTRSGLHCANAQRHLVAAFFGFHPKEATLP